MPLKLPLCPLQLGCDVARPKALGCSPSKVGKGSGHVLGAPVHAALDFLLSLLSPSSFSSSSLLLLSLLPSILLLFPRSLSFLSSPLLPYISCDRVSHVGQAGLKLIQQSRRTKLWQSSYLSPPSAEITGMNCHV